MDELHELDHAIKNESVKRQKEEAMDVLITALRFYLGEHLHEEKRND